MTSLKRTIRCTGCGNDMNFDINADMTMSELMISGKCPRCNTTIQVNYNMVSGSAPTPSQGVLGQSSESPSQMVNLDESLFTPEVPSDALKDIMED
jgi:phage FluMu protein Com